MNKWLLFLILLVAYLPFQLALNLAPDIDLMSGRILILGLFLIWLAREFYQKKDRGPAFFRNRVSWALVLFFILAVISIFAAVNQSWGLRKLLVFVSIFPVFFLVQALIKKEQNSQKLIYIMVGGAVVASIIALVQFLAQFVFGQEAVMNFWSAKIIPLFSGASFGALVVANPSWQVNVGGQTIMRAMGLFPDPHMLSFYLGLTSPFALAMLFFEKRFRLLLFTVNCLLLITLLLTFSRGGYLGLLASLAVGVFLAWREFNVKDKEFFSAFCLVAAIILLIIGWPILTRLASSFNLNEGSNIGRLAIWQESWLVIKKNPIIGVGLGNYSLAVSFGEGYRNAITSHNLYLDILSEMGLFGLLSWVLLILAAAREAFKKINRTPIVALGVLAALIYFSTHSFFETAIFNPTVLAFLMIILGLATAKTKEDVL